MIKIWIIVLAILVVGAAAYFFMMGNKPVATTTVATPSPTPTKVITQTKTIVVTPAPVGAMTATVLLLEQNESSESGTAVLTEKDGKTVVTLSMTGENTDGPQPAHIHIGPCPDVGSIVYPLTNVVKGKSETTINVTLAKLAAQQPLGINVHKSVPESKVYVSCGNLSLSTPTSPTATPVGR